VFPREPSTTVPKSAEEIITDQVLQHINDRVERYFENAARVSSLIALYNGLANAPDRLNREDILRAAVVFLHASLEDFLRGLAASYLPLADENALNAVPFVGTKPSGRAEKFLLGRLAAHRGKMVDDVLRESVEQHLERSNFNSTEEIAALLLALGYDLAPMRPLFPSLDAMMIRRHQIVHRADRMASSGGLAGATVPLTPAEVNVWSEATSRFVGRALTQLSLQDMKAGRLKLNIPDEFIPRPETPPSANTR
jgi:hypothetical protein